MESIPFVEAVPISAGEWKHFTSTPVLDLEPVIASEPEPLETSIVPLRSELFRVLAAEPVEMWLTLRSALSWVRTTRVPAIPQEWLRVITGAAQISPESWMASPAAHAAERWLAAAAAAYMKQLPEA